MPGWKQKRKFAMDAGRLSSTAPTLKFGDSAFFDYLYEKNRWGEVPMQTCADMATLVLRDFETFKDLREGRSGGCYPTIY